MQEGRRVNCSKAINSVYTTNDELFMVYYLNKLLSFVGIFWRVDGDSNILDEREL